MEEYVEVFFLNIVMVKGLKPRYPYPDHPIYPDYPVYHHTPVFLLGDRNKRVLAIPMDKTQYFVVKDVLDKRSATATLHDFIIETLKKFDLRIERTLIFDLHDDQYRMNVIITREKTNESMSIECRPSDAITLSILAKSPIFVKETILENAAIDSTKVFTTQQRLEKQERTDD